MTYSRAGGLNRFQSQLHPFRLHRKAAFAGALAVVCGLFMGLSSAQAGSVSGDVHGVTLNALGAPVAGVQVSVRSAEDNTERNVMSDRDGTFVVGNLRPGRYQLRATKEGLDGSSVATINLAAQQDLRVDMKLVPAGGSTAAAGPKLTADLRTPAATVNSPEAPLTDREKLLLERLDRLEQRLEAMEAKQAGAAMPATAAQPAPVAIQAKSSATTTATTQPAPAKHILLASLEGAFVIKSA